MSARFKAGDAVLVRHDFPAGHIRTPAYLRGKRGVVVRDFGAWRNPEKLAYGKPGWPLSVNYWVRFDMDEVWAGDGAYAPKDAVIAEIYEHWLEPAPAAGKGEGA